MEGRVGLPILSCWESLIVAVNMNTFVEQESWCREGFTGLAKLIQRIGLSFYDVQISFTFLNVLFNAVPAVFALPAGGKEIYYPVLVSSPD
ncbi:MAG: YitT family protein [Enterocloster clostridioformis]